MWRYLTIFNTQPSNDKPQKISPFIVVVRWRRRTIEKQIGFCFAIPNSIALGRNQSNVMAQSGKLMPNLDQNSTKLLNLTVLQRIDPSVEEILITAAHVTFYEFNIELSQWVFFFSHSRFRFFFSCFFFFFLPFWSLKFYLTSYVISLSRVARTLKVLFS